MKEKSNKLNEAAFEALNQFSLDKIWGFLNSLRIYFCKFKVLFYAMNEIRKFSDFVIKEIRQDLSEKIGFVICSKADCFKMSELILLTTGRKVSGSTLYRLFLYSSKHVPYVYTLDAISEFLGFDNWNSAYHYYQSNELRLLRMGLNISDDINRSLIFQNIEHNAYKPLHYFFDGINEEEYVIKEAVTFSLYDSLQRVSHTKSFFSHFASHSFIREFFFEIGADPTFRIKDYDFGLKCYLENSGDLTSELGLRDYIFASCMLFKHCHEVGNRIQLNKLGERLFADFDSMKLQVQFIHTFPKLRYLSLYLTYLTLKNATKFSRLEYAAELLTVAESYAKHPDSIVRNIVFYQIAESFSQNQIPEDFQFQLKTFFQGDIQKLPDSLASASLQKIMPYFQPNGILRNRKVHLN